MIIRTWREEDGAEPARIVRAVFDEYGFSWDEDDYCADLYDVKAHYIDRGHRFWVAEYDGAVIGTGALELFEEIPSSESDTVDHGGKIRVAGADCSLERLYVHPEARGLGAGSALFRQTIEEARALGRRRMEIWSDKKLENAHRLYGHFGAQVVGERICDDPDESPEWGLRLEL